MWIRALESHYWINKSVQPKQKKYEEANAVLQDTLKHLEESRASLSVVEQSIGALSAHYENALAKKMQLVEKVEDCQRKLVRAQKLIGGLEGERYRWEQMVVDLGRTADNVLGDALLSAAYLHCLFEFYSKLSTYFLILQIYVVYLPAFPAHYRAHILAEWKSILKTSKIPFYEPFILSASFSDPTSIRQWHLHGIVDCVFT